MTARHRMQAIAVVNATVLVSGLAAAGARSREAPPSLAAPPSAPPSGAPPTPPAPHSRPVTAADVLARLQPPSVAAKAKWSANLEASAERVVVYAPVVVTTGGSDVVVSLTSADPWPQTAKDGTVTYNSGTALVTPDGSRWYPLQGLTLSGAGQVSLEGASTSGGRVSGTVGSTEVARLIGQGGVEARGQFVTRDGREATTLRLPPGTKVWSDCATTNRSAPPPPCPNPSAPSSSVVVESRPGVGLEVDVRSGGAELEVVGSARASALGTTWEGMTGSLEADDLRATLRQADGRWTVSAQARSARQVWIDVWPVVSTVLQVRGGYDDGAHSCVRDCSVRLRYTNVGFASAQIFEAEALGAPNAVALGINQTKTHDAGLGVQRGGREINLRSGRGVDSHLPPGARHDRGLTVTGGVPTTIVLRGNFPEVRAELPIPPANPATPRPVV